MKGIGWWAFAGCISLTSVNIPNSVTNIGNYAFSGCSGLTSVTIPNSVTSIGREAFSNCHGLTSIYIPNSITSIGKDAFSGCDCLTGVYINNVGEWCKIIFDNSYSNPLRCAHKLFINGEEIRDLVIPNGVTSIGDYSFCGCSCITSVTIPNNVTAIREGAFYGCSGLTSVTIGSGVKLLYKHAFDTQSELKDVYCYAINVPGTESDAIYNSKYATLHVPEQSIDAYKAADPWKRFKNIVALKDSDPKPDVTGVNVIRSSGVKMAVSYNLNGVRLSEPQKGINIINGKKYVKK